MPSSQRTIYVGTYTTGRSEGIYRCRLDLHSGALYLEGVAAQTANPSFLLLHPSHRFLYAVNEQMTFDGLPGGAVCAFAIDPQTGALKLLNQQPTHGGAPCHLSIDPTGRWLFVANYMGGNACSFVLEESGHLGEMTTLVQHEGHGPNLERQEAAHAHSITLDPANRFALVADLGIDKLMIYRLLQGKLRTHDVPSISLPAGAGPRHLAFHPAGNYAYLINELNNTIVAYAYDSINGRMEAIQTVPALPKDFHGDNFCADIHLSPDGSFLYGSNRGHDSLVIYAIEKQTGKLVYVGHESTRGKWPRNFAIDPAGNLLLVANQHSNTILTFRIDRQTGTLTATGHKVEVPAPVCIAVA